MAFSSSCASPPVRWIFCLLSIYAAALVYISRSGMAVAVIAMVSYDDEKAPEFEWSETMQVSDCE